MNQEVEKIFLETINLITGINSPFPPLGGIKILPPEKLEHKTQKIIADFFTSLVKRQKPVHKDTEFLFERYKTIKEIFNDYYQQSQNQNFLFTRWKLIQESSADQLEAKAQAITEIWAPEIALAPEEIFPRWCLKEVKENPQPYLPSEIIIPLNAMYGLPQEVPADLPESLKNEWKRVEKLEDEVYYDYDHPVHLFAPDDQHELINCLRNLDQDVAFEKQQGVLPSQHKVIVPVSVSVTHPRLDRLAGQWLTYLLRKNSYQHLKIFILTQENVTKLKEAIGLLPSVP